ncbi:MAG: hypothetical protein KGH98_00220 [Candidatus Micrarchaeota archaeon]|nr:hypothetical protein [Candidatus Micrarchaeota archaeon]
MGITRYRKGFTREHRLLVIQMWEDQLTKEVKRSMGWAAPFTIFDASDGIATLYFREGYGEEWEKQIAENVRKDRRHVTDSMKRYSDALGPLEAVFARGEALGSAEELSEYYNAVVRAWVGLDMAFIVPDMKDPAISEADRKIALEMRKKSENFSRHVDFIVGKTIRKLYPQLGEYADYLSMEEITAGAIPQTSELEARKRHYIYFNYSIFTGIELPDFLAKNNLASEEGEARPADVISGKAAVAGTASGRVRIIMKREQLRSVEQGEVLVAPMTTPDYVSAMAMASAIVTDEGGITCHAAINSRELNKPCVVGTRIATKVLKDGYLVRVDAVKGTITILDRG